MKVVASRAPAASDPAFDSPIAVGIVADPIRCRRLEVLLVEEPVVVRARWRSLDECWWVAHGAPDAVVVYSERVGTGEQSRLHELRRQLPQTAILVVLGELGMRSLRQALDAGVDGVVEDAETERCLAPALRAVCAGQLVLPQAFRDGSRRPPLSPREKQVLGLVVMGFGNAGIARKLHVAESTVKSHLTSAFTKLGVRSRSEASALILDPVHGLGLGVLAISSANGSGE